MRWGLIVMSKERFTVKNQDDYFGVVDNNTGDKTCVVNGIRTEIEAEWLCELMNDLAEENRKLKGGIYPVDIDIICRPYVTTFAESYVTLVKLDQELERIGFSENNMQRIKIRNKMKSKFESMLFEFIHWSRIKGVF